MVTLRKGNLVWIVAKENASKKFMEVYPYVVSGYELDGTEHTATLKLHGSETFDFKYTASTDNEFAEALKSFLTGHSFTDWSAYIKDGDIYLQYDNYTSAEYLSANITQATGITLKAKCEIDMPAAPKALRKCGNLGNFVWNVARAKQFFKNDQTNTGFNPVSDVKSVPAYPICWPAFCGKSQYRDADHCLWLRLKYCKDPDNPTFAEWETYIEDLCPVNPAMVGLFAPKWRGSDVFDKIKNITYMATDGSQRPLYTGANYCSTFFDGNGYMLAPCEFYEMFKNITLGLSGITIKLADAINRSLNAIGGDTISIMNPCWFCTRLDAGSGYGSSHAGHAGSGYLLSSSRCIPVLHLELPLE